MTVPNLLSLLRMGLIPVFVISVVQGNPGRAIAVFCLAGITDALDGAIARYLRQQSLLGMYLDPIADKLLLVSAYVLLSIPGAHTGLQIPVWVTVLVFARDLLIVVVALIVHLTLRVAKFPPTWISKVNTVAQILAVLLVLLSGLRPEVAGAALASVYLVAALTVLSGVDYVFRLHRLPAVQSKPAE
jgi:cardiolipin synthase (CMP-forming)